MSGMQRRMSVIWLEKITFLSITFLSISRLQVTVLAFLDPNPPLFFSLLPADTFLSPIASKDALYR